MQDCGSGGKRWGEQGKCYEGPDAARKAYAQGMAMGEVSKAEFEGLWGSFTKADLTSAVEAIAIAKYNASHDEHGRFSNLDHVPDSSGTRFTLGDAVKHADTGRIGMVTETHPDPKGKNHTASVLFGDQQGVFRSNVQQAFKTQRVPTSKLQVVPMKRLPKAAAERCLIFKDWAAFDAERDVVGRVGSAAGRAAGGLMNKVAGVLTQAGHGMAGGRNRNGFLLGGGGGGGGPKLATGKGGGKGGGKGRAPGKAKGPIKALAAAAKVPAARVAAAPAQRAAAAARPAPQINFISNPNAQFQSGAMRGGRVHKDEVDGGGDNPESIKVSYRGKNAETAVAAAHNTLHHAGLDSTLHRGPLTGPHLHVGPQSQQSGPMTYSSLGDGVAQDIESGVKPDRALIAALHAAGVVRDPNNPFVDVDQSLVDEFVQSVQMGQDPADLAQQVISYLQQGDDVQKGDLPGHEFHGNQHTGGAGSETGPGKTGVDWERLSNENAYREGRKIGGRMGNLKSPKGASRSTRVDPNKKWNDLTAEEKQQVMATESDKAYFDRTYPVRKQEPSSSDVHVNAVAGAINPGRMHAYKDNGSGRCSVCGGVKDQGIHKGEIAKIDIEFPIWIDKAEEKHVSYGVALHPELRDSQGDRVSQEDIEATAHRFMVMYRETGVQHEGDALPTVQVVESYIAPQQMTFTDNRGREHTVLKGSWLLGHKINDPVLWERVKKGVDDPDADDALSGLSIQGTGIRLAE